MDSLTQTFTIIGVLGGLFLIFFKLLRDDIKSVRSDLSGEIKSVRNEVKDVRSELGGDIKAVRTELKDLRTELKEDIEKLDGKVENLSKDVNILGQKVSHMDGQLSQVTQMLYFKPTVHDKLDDAKEN